MIKILLSTKLGELRRTQADLARATGIRPSTINEYYHELSERVNLEHLDKICDALDCELEEILVRVPNKTANKSDIHTPFYPVCQYFFIKFLNFFIKKYCFFGKSCGIIVM